jgi:hypothetical protein
MYPWVDKKIQQISNDSPDRAGLKERREAHLKEFAEKGWCTRDLWMLNTVLAEFIHPRLTDFYNRIVCNNSAMYNKKEVKEFELMLYAFKVYIDDRSHLLNQDERKKVKKGLKLFGDYFPGLWC